MAITRDSENLYSSMRFVGDGVTKRVPLTFALREGDGLAVDFGEGLVTEGYLIDYETTPVVVVFSEPLPKDKTVTIRRLTKIDKVKHVFQWTGNAQGGADFSAKNVDENFEQITRASQDAMDAQTLASETLEEMAGIRDTAIDARDKAKVSEGNAKASETNAKTSETNASNSANRARDSENLAKKWATNPEDVEVEDDKYSAMHWAMKAKDFSGIDFDPTEYRKKDTFYLSESGNAKVDGVYGNDTVCSKAQESGAVVYVPHGTYYLTNSLKYPNLFFYGEGVIRFDNADFIRLGGSAGNTRLSEQYTMYYNYDSKEDVSVLKNDMGVPFSWLNDWLIDVPSVVGSTRDDLFTVRVKNGTYNVSRTPECIALSSSGNNINPEYNKQSLAWGKGSHTTKYGSRAGQRSLYVNNSTFFGAKAGASVEAGGNNCFFGYNAGQRVLSASNTIMGSVAGEWVTEGAENSYYGMGAGAHNLTGSKNVAVGNYSANHNGDRNTVIGYYAQSSIGEGKSSVGNVSVGAYARQYSSGDRNTAVGYSSGQGEVGDDYPAKNTAVDNVSIGWGSLKKIASGSSIVAIGVNAMSNMKSGGDGVAIGFNSQKDTTQGACVSIGHSTLSSNITGRRNTVVGTRALSLCNSNDNTAMGYEAGSNLIDGFNNTFVGELAGNLMRSGANNTFIGRRAGSSQVSKGNNTYVGAETGTDLEDGVSNSSVLGYQAKVTGDNQVQLGNASTTTYVFGTVQNRSDARDKKDIADLSLGLDFVMQLKPKQFKWDYREWQGKNTGKRDHVGFIAQDLQEALRDTNYAFVQDHSVNGGSDVLSVGYDEFIGVLTKAIQEQQKQIEELQDIIAKLK